MISNYRIVWRLKRPQLNVWVEEVACYPQSKSETLHLLAYIAKWINHQNILVYQRRIYPLLWEPKMPIARPTEASKTGEPTLNTSLSISNWVCRHSSASSEPVLKRKLCYVRQTLFVWFLITFPWASCSLGLICSVIVLKHKLQQASKQQTKKGSLDPRNP